MLISEKYNFAFIHIPRTGGNSVHATLAAYCGLDVESAIALHRVQMVVTHQINQGIKVRLADTLQHTPLKYFVSTAGHPTAALTRLLYRNFSSYRTFSFVRNPYERIVSNYVRAKLWDNVDVGFEDYVKAAYLHCQPQVNFISLGNRIIVDFIGHHERLQDDFDYVCNWLGFPKMPLPILSATPEVDYRDYLTPKTKRMIEDKFDGDFSAFGYKRL